MVEGLVGWVTALDPLGVTTASWQAGSSTTDKEGCSSFPLLVSYRIPTGSSGRERKTVMSR